MFLQKKQPDSVTIECSSHDKVFLGTLETQDNPSTSTIASIEQRKNRTKVMTEIQVTADSHNTHMVPFTRKIETGAEINVISKQAYDRVNPNPQHRRLGPMQYRITAYGGYTIKTLGNCPLYVHRNGSIKEIIFNVTDVPGPVILGCNTCEKLELVKFNCSLETSKETRKPILNNTHHANRNRGPAETLAIHMLKHAPC